MANEFKVKKGLIVQGSGSTGDTTILDVQGNQGQLFSITDSLEGTLFSVSDISGIPILDVNSNETVKIGTFGNEGIIVNGSNVTSSGNISASGTITANSLVGTVGTATQGTIDIHSLSGYVANEHLDWTSNVGTIHSGNYTDTNTTYSVGDGGLTTNNFTDADHSKLNAIEASADVTDATNVTAAGALMDSELTSIANVKALNQSLVSGATPTFTTTNFTDASNKRLMTDAQETKLDSVASSANNYSHPTSAGNKHIPTGGTVGQILKNTASGTATWQTDANTTYSVGDGGLTTNDFTDADHTKLNAIEASATADQTAAQIKTLVGTGNSKFVPAAGTAGHFLKHDGTFGIPAYTTNTNTTYSVGDGGLTTNDFTNADHSKLNAIEASADVTDAANVLSSLPSGVVSGSAQIDIHTTTGYVANEHLDWTSNVGTIHAGNYTDTNTTYSVTNGQLSQNNLTNALKTSYDGAVTHAATSHAPSGATVNSADATLLGRANHTGTQAASTISDFDTEVANNSAVELNTAKTSNIVQTTVTGNAGTVTNGVYTTGTQTIAGAKTFSGTVVAATIRPTEIAYKANVGSDHALNGTTLSGTTLGTAQGTAVVQGSLTYLSTGGRWEKTDSDALATSFGMLAIQAGEDQTEQLLVNGLYNLSYDPGGSRGDPLYISGTAGLITSTAPTGTGDIVRIVGYKMHATNGLIYFNPDQTWVELT